MFEVKLKDGSVKEFDEEISLLDVCKSISEGLARDCVGAVVDGKIMGLMETIDSDCEVQFVKFDDEEGKQVFWHTSSHLMAYAIQRLYPNTKFAIGPSIDSGFYYDLDTDHKFVPEDLEKIVTDTERRTNSLVDSAQKDINSAIQNMRDEADTIRKNLSDETAGAVTKPDLDTTLSNYVTTVDFNNALNNKADKGQVAPSNLPDNFNELINQAVTNRISELNQNKALFNNNGEVYEINNPDLSTMDFVDKSGYFYAVGPLHTPDGNDTEGMLQILAYGNYTKVIYSPNETNAIYLRSKLNQVGNNWTDWLNIGSEVEIGTNDSYVEENDVDTSIDDSTETT